MTRLTLPVLLLSSAALVAQGPGGPGNSLAPAIATTTDYAVLAGLGGTTAFDSVAAATPVGTGLEVIARTGTGANCLDLAAASSRIQRPQRNAVEVLELGIVRNSDPNRGALAGTSADAPTTASPVQGAHAFAITYGNIGQGVDAIVVLRWAGDASPGASCTAAVDVDGDGIADFTAVANGTRVATSLQVTGGSTGVTVAVTTNGQAALTADGEERYHAALRVEVFPGTLTTSCTFTSFGPSCGADLDGTVATNLDLALDVSNAAADAIGILVMGPQLAVPVPAPIGPCDLLVGLTHHGRWFRTDATGAASIPVRTPTIALTISFQALVLGRTPTGQFVLDTSNGVELVCQ